MLIKFVKSIFRFSHSVPVEHRKNFWNLYLDIGWYGVLNGTTIAFLSIYAARMGASAGQLGLISAAPAIISLFVALPAGAWLKVQSTRKAVVWSTISFRVFYLLIILLPILNGLISSRLQVGMITGIIFLMSIPGTALSISFNAFFGETVPQEWRGSVLGIRNAIFAIVTTLSALLAGWLLNSVIFPYGYAYVFGLGFLGAVMSSLHLFSIHPPVNQENAANRQERKFLKQIFLTLKHQLRPNIFEGPFRTTIILLFLFHLAQYLPIPIFPIYSVNVLKLNDQVISLGTAIFNLALFLGSTQFSRLIRRFRSPVMTGAGMMILAIFPVLLAISRGAPMYLLAHVIGGLGWSICASSIYTYLYESIPDQDKSIHLAWFNLGSNAAILLGSLIGPLIGELIGLQPVLFLYAIIRAAVGYTIARKG